jgi:hypothetical protein
MSQKERSIFWGVTVSVILSKYIYVCMCVLFRTVSEIEIFQGSAVVATRHVITRVTKCIDVDGGIFEHILY